MCAGNIRRTYAGGVPEVLPEISPEIMAMYLSSDAMINGDAIKNVGYERKEGVTYQVTGHISTKKNELHLRFEEQINSYRKGGRQFRMKFNLKDFEDFIKILKIQADKYDNR